MQHFSSMASSIIYVYSKIHVPLYFYVFFQDDSTINGIVRPPATSLMLTCNDSETQIPSPTDRSSTIVKSNSTGCFPSLEEIFKQQQSGFELSATNAIGTARSPSRDFPCKLIVCDNWQELLYSI